MVFHQLRRRDTSRRAETAERVGLYDTAGNVCEWVQDSAYFNAGSSITDPAPNTSGGNKIFRGGSHGDDAASCRPGYRNSISQTLAMNIFGLRVVLARTTP